MMSVFRGFIAVEHDKKKDCVALIQTYSLKDLREDFIGDIQVYKHASSSLTQTIKRLILLTGNGDCFNLPGTRLTINAENLFQGKLSAQIRHSVFPLGEYKTVALKGSKKVVKLMFASLFKNDVSILEDIIKKGDFVEVDKNEKKSDKKSNKKEKDGKSSTSKTNKKGKNGKEEKDKSDDDASKQNTSSDTSKVKKDKKKKNKDKSSSETDDTNRSGSLVVSTDVETKISVKNLRASDPIREAFASFFKRDPTGDEEFESFKVMYNLAESKRKDVNKDSAGTSGVPENKKATSTPVENPETPFSWVDEAESETSKKENEEEESEEDSDEE